MKPTREQFADALSLLGAARYADIRYTATHRAARAGAQWRGRHLSSTVDRAIGVRVLVGNGWGFAAISDTCEESIRRTARRALEVAAASNIASTQTRRR